MDCRANDRLLESHHGEVAERLIALVSKTNLSERITGVRIPPSPFPRSGDTKTPKFSGVLHIGPDWDMPCPGLVPGTNRKESATIRTSRHFSSVNPFEHCHEEGSVTKRNLLHEALRILIRQAVVHRPHGPVGMMAKPLVDRTLRNAGVHRVRLEKKTQRMQRETTLPSRGWEGQLE